MYFALKEASILKKNFFYSIILATYQSLYEEAAAAECTESDAEELCCLPQTQELAVVATVHQGTVHIVSLDYTTLEIWTYFEKRE